MYCPVCKAKYRDNLRVCVDCGGALVCEPPRGTALVAGQYKPQYEYANLRLVKGFCEDVEAAMIKSLLESEGIHAFERHYGAGGFLKHYTGKSNSVQILVPDSDFNKARELLAEYNYMEYSEDFDDIADESYAEHYDIKHRVVSVVAVLLAVVLILYFSFRVLV